MANITLCDFCNVPNPQWSYPCSDFAAPGGVSRSVGNWLACNHCMSLIEGRHKARLLSIAVDAYLLDHPEDILDVNSIREFAEEVHRLFFANITGNPTPTEVPFARA